MRLIDLLVKAYRAPKYLERHRAASGSYVYRYTPRAVKHHAVQEQHGQRLSHADWRAKPAAHVDAPALPAHLGQTVGPDVPVISEHDLKALHAAAAARRDLHIDRRLYVLTFDPWYADHHVPDEQLAAYADDCVELARDGVEFVFWKDAIR